MADEITDTTTGYHRTVARITQVDTIEQAFAFALTTIEEERITEPIVYIDPVEIRDIVEDENGDLTYEDASRTLFEVKISGETGSRA